MKENVSQEWKIYQKEKPNYTKTNLYQSQIYTINPAWTTLGSNTELYFENF
jgi:hypothetical protein